MSTPSEPGDTPASDSIRRTAAFVDGRIAEYSELWLDASRRLTEDTYSASDLITGWFSLWGKGVRDLQSAGRMWWPTDGATPKQAAESSGPGPGTIFVDRDVDIPVPDPNAPPSFSCSDLLYRATHTVAVPASNVTLESHLQPGTGKGFVRVIIVGLGLDAGLLIGKLYQSQDPQNAISTINMSIPPAYSRY